MRLSLLLALFFASLCASPAAAKDEPATLDALLEAFAGMPGLEAKFVEEKRMALLAAPLTSKGRIYFAPPGLLARHVESPRRSKVVITPEALRFADARGAKKIDLGARPDVKLFVESFVRVLAGDREALGHIYDIEFTPATEAAPWQIQLTPKGPPLSKLVEHLRIRGRGLVVETIRVKETGGDESLTRIVEADPAREFTAAERKKLFE